MARIEGTQNIPAEWIDAYRATLTEKMPGAAARKRYPFRLPQKEDGGYKVTENQKKHRTKWKEIRDKFNDTTPADRERWYAARPVWHSFLWYYNYFMMSGLSGNAVVGDKGGGVIKTIQNVLVSIPAGAGTGTGSFSTVNPGRAIVMINGNSLAIDEEPSGFFAAIVYPYVLELASAAVKLKWALPAPHFSDTKAAVVSATIIEYI